jgi:hypothetical protein
MILLGPVSDAAHANLFFRFYQQCNRQPTFALAGLGFSQWQLSLYLNQSHPLLPYLWINRNGSQLCFDIP